jgi:hydrogenase nickel incorporation protein HypB
MCRDCGCEQANQKHHHDQRLSPRNLHGEPVRRIELELNVLAKNDRIAQENRSWLGSRGIRTINLISSPGSGKTTLLERTVDLLGEGAGFAVLTGDQERDFDAQRLRKAGAEVKQINTFASCHLDATMIKKELGGFVKDHHRVLVLENVGNLVCPAAFDLGESEKVALLSVTEGEDKPSKYPLLFREATLVVLSKIDLIPHLDWKLELCLEHIRRVNPRVPVMQLSARTGEGLGAWAEFLKQ